MRRNTHLIGGILFGLTGYFILVSVRLGTISPYSIFFDLFEESMMVKTTLLFVFLTSGALIPDKLDPPFSPKHRKFAHSKAILFLFITITALTLFLLSIQKNLVLWSLYFFLLGYISHLALDSLTPGGLW
ncbi:MAG: metal-dependent hydrolase [Thermoplasmatota archaeon]